MEVTAAQGLGLEAGEAKVGRMMMAFYSVLEQLFCNIRTDVI